MWLRIVLISIIIAPSLCARILGIAPIPSYSHQVVYRPIWRELSLRGHQMTVITSDPVNNSSLTNLTEIDVHSTYQLINKIHMVNVSQKGLLGFLDDFINLANDIVDEELHHPEIQALIKNESEHFDLIIVECFYPGMYAFVKRFNCPFIGIASMDARLDNYDMIGNPTHPVAYPDFMSPYSGKMTFLERLTNTLTEFFMKVLFIDRIYHAHQSLVQKHFGEAYPPLQDIFRNVSLLFVNTDPIFHQIRPLLPSIIQIGVGTHLTPPQPLPKDLQKILDNASQGFIYFSLGSNVKSKELPADVCDIILRTFTELPYLILWKFELEDLPGKPDNVIISKWFPQQDILRHPHIKLFITQGGQQSLDEAVYSHVPILGMPFFADQPMNIKKAVMKGLGLSVDYKTLDKATFKSTILEVITNTKYRKRVKELAELANDQPMTGLERAIWWTEYVLRHKGAHHLRSPAIDLPLYQYFLLDVIGFCILIKCTAIYLFIIAIKFVFKIFKYFKSKPKVKVQ